MEGGRAPQGGGRVLVGFLVTFDMDDAPQGRFFPLYQGRTLIGRDMDPTMGAVVDVRGDLKVSGSHALLLHRNGKLIMEDQMSTCGTFVDESTLGIAGRSELVGGPQFVRDDGAMFCGRPVKLYSIENEKVELYDNSIIAVGKTLMQVKLIGWPERALIY